MCLFLKYLEKEEAMVYSWDIDELKKRRRHLLNELLGNSTLIDRKKIKSDFNLLNDMIDELEVNKCFNLFSSKEKDFIDDDKLLSRSYYNAFSKISNNLLNLVYKITNNFDLVDLDEISKDLSFYDFNLEKIIESTKSFYDSLPNKNYYLEISKFLNPNNHLLFFKYGSLFNLDSGNTYNLFYPNIVSYILVYIVNDISDLLTLDHELAHAYFNKYNSLEAFNTPYYYLTEIEGMFFEYLKEEFLINNNYYQNDIKLCKNIKMNSIVEISKNLYIGNFIFNYYNKKGIIDEAEITETLFKQGILNSYNINAIYDSLLMYPRNIIKECISYLTFLDLKEIATNDLEKALYLLEEIRKDHNHNIFSTLRKNEITFMDDNFDNFKKEYVKINKYNNLQ